MKLQALQTSVLDHLDRPGPLTTTAVAAAAFGTMIAGAAGTLHIGSWRWRVLLVSGSLVWPLPTHPLQGPVVTRLTYYHGVHVADLLSLVGLIVAVIPWHRRRS